ncbi:hypothetical protein [Tumebacillus lipolyticus]|uniref:DUF4345 domain-containing protein n=1 Tax=Tumebacillus lipolyticus TaxID=1280370 RepID=A0ABW4ZSI0_9BACL
MQTFLLIISYPILLLSLVSFWQTIRQKPEGFFHDLERAGMGNGIRQVIYGITGVYLLYVLTAMNHVRPLSWYGWIVIFESLLFLLSLRGDLTKGLLIGWYRRGPGLYISSVLNTLFPLTAIYLLQFS